MFEQGRTNNKHEICLYTRVSDLWNKHYETHSKF